MEISIRFFREHSRDRTCEREELWKQDLVNGELELCCDLKEIQWTLWVAKMDGPLELSEIG